VLWHCWLGGRKGIWPVKKLRRRCRWALVSPDGVAPSRMVSVSASVIFPCTIKSTSSLPAPAHPDGPWKRAVKWLWCGGCLANRSLTGHGPAVCWESLHGERNLSRVFIQQCHGWERYHMTCAAQANATLLHCHASVSTHTQSACTCLHDDNVFR